MCKRVSTLSICLGFVIGLFLFQGANAQTFQSVSTYNANNGGNVVDTDTGGTLGSFATAVTNAYFADRGGVIDFETGFPPSSNPTNIGTSFTASYGTSGSKMLAFTSTNGSTGNNDQLIYGNNTANQVDTISGPNNLLPNTNNLAFSLNVGPITGGEIDEMVSEIALTVLSRSVFQAGGATAEVKANYSDGTMETKISNISNVIGADDTFFHFVAPTNESVVSLDFLNSSGLGTANQRRLPVDDLAFITSVAAVPEPASVAIWSLLGLGLAGFGYYRVRRKK